MEEDNNDLFFETVAPNEDQDISAPLASQHEDQRLGNELEDIPLATTKKKRNVKSGPKLDVGRLLGARGLPCLDAEFENVKFHGKGHEVEDLDKLLSHLEHWAHRLYPRMTFDDCLERLEKLGHKKEIQTCMKKIRMNMPLLMSDQQTTVITEDCPILEEEFDGTDINLQ